MADDAALFRPTGRRFNRKSSCSRAVGGCHPLYAFLGRHGAARLAMTLRRRFCLKLANGCGVGWWMDAVPFPSAPDTVCANLRTILHGLRAALGAFGLEPVLALLLHRRIGGIAGRIERMLVRFRAGRLWRVMGRATRVGAIRRTNCTLPRRFGWLVRAGGHRAAAFGTQLQNVLNAPEIAELLAASPEAGRILRPLCRALAVELPVTEVRPRRTAAVCGERPIRRRPRRAVPEPFRIPLPRGVLTAAKREGFGKDR